MTSWLSHLHTRPKSAGLGPPDVRGVKITLQFEQNHGMVNAGHALALLATHTKQSAIFCKETLRGLGSSMIHCWIADFSSSPLRWLVLDSQSTRRIRHHHEIENHSEPSRDLFSRHLRALLFTDKNSSDSQLTRPRRLRRSPSIPQTYSNPPLLNALAMQKSSKTTSQDTFLSRIASRPPPLSSHVASVQFILSTRSLHCCRCRTCSGPTG